MNKKKLENTRNSMIEMMLMTNVKSEIVEWKSCKLLNNLEIE